MTSPEPKCPHCGDYYLYQRIARLHRYCLHCDYWPDFQGQNPPFIANNKNADDLTKNDEAEPMPNPFRNSNTKEITLTDPKAPHETAAVLRLHRLGWTSVQICCFFHIRQRSLIGMLKLAMDEETEAHRTGVPVYDGTKEKKG